MEVVRKPKELTAKEKMRVNVAKNCLIVTLMSLDVGYGSILERYQRECNSAELLTRMTEHVENSDQTSAAPAAMPPPTTLARSKIRMPANSMSANNVETTGVKDANLKLYHVMSLREDLAEHAYQFSCRAADWSRSDFCSVPMQFEPLELHVVDALGQQEVPDYFQQPAKAITEDVSVMRGPQAQEWTSAVREEIESSKDWESMKKCRRGVQHLMPYQRDSSCDKA